jgi:hypothetical protein
MVIGPNVTEMSNPNEVVLLLKLVEGRNLVKAAAFMPPWGPEKMVRIPGLPGAVTVAVADRVSDVVDVLVAPPGPTAANALAGTNAPTSNAARPIAPVRPLTCLAPASQVNETLHERRPSATAPGTSAPRDWHGPSPCNGGVRTYAMVINR